jgi:pyrimidine deaminase RibD-like protein
MVKLLLVLGSIEGDNNAFMAEAINEARAAGAAGDVPIGAVIVKDGEIVEQGTHRELLRRKGHYLRLYAAQYEETEEAWDKGYPRPLSRV